MFILIDFPPSVAVCDSVCVHKQVSFVLLIFMLDWVKVICIAQSHD